jgi:hypothetical protein
MPEPEKIKELLDMVSERIPNLLKKLGDVLYSEDQAHTFGKAVAIFYNELKDTGMTQEQIFELTKAYMSTLNMGNMMGQMGKGFGPGKGHHGPPWKNRGAPEECDDEE